MTIVAARLDDADAALEYDDEQEKIWPDNESISAILIKQPEILIPVVAQEEPPAQNFRRLKGSFH